MNSKSFSPEALLEARLARGYNKAQLAHEIQVSRQAISLIEKGENNPSPETIRKIAKVLDLPFGYFFAEPARDFAKETPTFYRELTRTTNTIREMAGVVAKWYYGGYLELSKYLKRIPPHLPDFCLREEYDFITLSDDAIEEYANELRAFWGLGRGPILGLTQLMERNGVVILQIPMDRQEINGFSFYADGRIPFIVCSGNVSAVRHRYNLAHEIGHLVLHAVLDKEEHEKNISLIEKQAHRFASAFLFPRERFLEEFLMMDMTYLVDLKRRWGMSVTAIVKRARNFEMIGSEEEAYFYKRNPGIRRSEPLDDELEIEHPTFQKNGFSAVLKANLASVEDFKYHLLYSSRDLSQMFYAEPTVFDLTTPTNIIQFK